MVGIIVCVNNDTSHSSNDDNSWKLFEPNIYSIGSLGLFSLSVCSHSISPNFYQALENRSPAKFAKTTSLGFIGVFVLNMIVAIVGYLRFGKTAQANVLESYTSHQFSALDITFVNIARVKYIL